MKYKVVRSEFEGDVLLASCDFEDKEIFSQISQLPRYKILKDNKDITEKYKKKERESR